MSSSRVHSFVIGVACLLVMLPASQASSAVTSQSKVGDGRHVHCHELLDEAIACGVFKVDGVINVQGYIFDRTGGRNVRVAIQNVRFKVFAYRQDRWVQVDGTARSDADGFWDQSDKVSFLGVAQQQPCRKYVLVADIGFRHNGFNTFKLNKVLIQRKNPC